MRVENLSMELSISGFVSAVTSSVWSQGWLATQALVDFAMHQTWQVITLLGEEESQGMSVWTLSILKKHHGDMPGAGLSPAVILPKDSAQHKP